jgi:hypothetical protein
MTGSPAYKASTERAIAYIAAIQYEQMGWRYGAPTMAVIAATSDTSNTFWMVAAARSAEMAVVQVPGALLLGGRAWVIGVTDALTARTRYIDTDGVIDRLPRSTAELHETNTAAAIIVRMWAGDARTEPLLRLAAARLIKSVALPAWDTGRQSVDLCYWYVGSLALFQMGERYWERWNVAMKQALIPNQHRIADGDLDGSWDPSNDAWGAAGGRVYTTALAVLTLETYYRYNFIGSTRG